jgi:hypothetical protein
VNVLFNETIELGYAVGCCREKREGREIEKYLQEED